MAINLTDPIFTDEAKAREHLEAIRWPDGPTCPHCGEAEKVYRLNGKKHRAGLIHCNSCAGSFTVTTDTVMGSSHVLLNKWVLAYRLMASSKKGISAHQLHRTIAVTYKTAWFMAHRIREAMAPHADVFSPIGGEGKTIEIDETFTGYKDDAGPTWEFHNESGWQKKRGYGDRRVVLTLVRARGPGAFVSCRQHQSERATRGNPASRRRKKRADD